MHPLQQGPSRQGWQTELQQHAALQRQAARWQVRAAVSDPNCSRPAPGRPSGSGSAGAMSRVSRALREQRGGGCVRLDERRASRAACLSCGLCAQLTWPSRYWCTMRAGELGRGGAVWGGGGEDGLGDGGRGRGAVDVGPAGDARGEHALREEECEPEADRGGVLRAEQRLLGVVRQRRLHVPHDVAQGSAEEVRNREGIERRGGEARGRDRASRAVDSCDAAGSRIVGA